jgi:hypothetical protein
VLLGRAALLVALAVGLAACGDDDPAPAQDLGGDSSSDATVDDTESSAVPDVAADVAALEELHADFWNARIRSHNGPLLDADLYDGITTPEFAEVQLGYVQSQLITHDFHRAGQPKVSDVTATVDGDRARIEACIDQRSWRVVAAGEEVEVDLSISPQVLRATRTGQGWRLTEQLPSKRADLTC